MYDPLAPQNENGIAGKPLQATADANGNVFESLQAANAIPEAKPKPDIQEAINDLHKNSAIPNLRTYESDIAEAIRNQQSSIVKIAVAEKNREKKLEAKETIKQEIAPEAVLKTAEAVPEMQPAAPEPQPQPRSKPERRIVIEEPASEGRKINIVILGLSVLLILAGLATVATFGYVMFRQWSNRPVAVKNDPRVTTTDASKQIIVGPGDNLVDILKREQGTVAGADGSLISLAFYVASTTGNSKDPMSASEFAIRLSKNAPTWFARSLSENFVAGFYIKGAERQPFMVFKTASYENAFSGMLAWETTLTSDLRKILPQYERALPAATTTAKTTKTAGKTAAPSPAATSTPPLMAPIPWNTFFDDTVISNKDVRIVRDAAGNSILLYAFPDKQTLVITASDAAIKEIFARLATMKFAR